MALFLTKCHFNQGTSYTFSKGGMKMVYRPTVRNPDIYKNYVDDLFKATRLDRNQIIRLALFTAAHSSEFNDILKKHKIDDVTLPRPEWGRDEERAWMDQNYIKKKPEPAPIRVINKGGITIRLG